MKEERKIKSCSSCKKELPILDFYYDKKRKQVASRCKMCANYYSRKVDKTDKKFYDINKLYFIDKEEYIGMELAQESKCCICKNKEKLVVDHCHSSGKVRGLLCRKCNSGLGLFGDSVVFLKNAIEYLEKQNKVFYV